MSRVANKVYEAARAGTLSLNGFPNFSPLLNALRTSNPSSETKTFRVTCQKHDTLVILEIYAKKWLENSDTKDRALEEIENHNRDYNPAGVYWIEEKTLMFVLQTLLSDLFSLYRFGLVLS